MILTYRDSVETYTDHNGNLLLWDLMKLLHDHGVTWREWQYECDSYNADKVMDFLGY
jgi:hypothetical protein